MYLESDWQHTRWLQWIQWRFSAKTAAHRAPQTGVTGSAAGVERCGLNGGGMLTGRPDTMNRPVARTHKAG